MSIDKASFTCKRIFIFILFSCLRPYLYILHIVKTCAYTRVLCIYVYVHKLISIIIEPADCWHRDYYCLLLKLISSSLHKHFPQLSAILMTCQIGCQADYFTTSCILDVSSKCQHQLVLHMYTITWKTACSFLCIVYWDYSSTVI